MFDGPLMLWVNWPVADTVEALLTDTLVSGQLYLLLPCSKPRFNSHTNSVFLHPRKRTFL